jgi:hypothetical protein
MLKFVRLIVRKGDFGLYDFPGNSNAICIAVLSIPNIRRTIEPSRMVIFVVTPSTSVTLVKIIGDCA